MEKKATFIQGYHHWSFCPGVPQDGWQNARRQGKDFILDVCINLDVLCAAPPVPGLGEGVLYADFATADAGMVLVGLGCDGCMEVCCDGKTLFSTFSEGNGATYIFPSNHRVRFPVTAGTHLLAIHVRRGEKSWNFACGGVTEEKPAEPEIAVGPWLANPDADKVTVALYCKTPLGIAVRYRRKGEGVWRCQWHHRQGQCLRRRYHAVQLSGLEMDADYEYSIVCIHPDTYMEVSLGGIHEFRTFGTEKQHYSFFFTADLQFPLELQQLYLGNMLKAANAASCDFFVLDGDVNSDFCPEDVIDGPFRQLCQAGADRKPIVYVRGNHELRGEQGDFFLDYFAQNNGCSYDIVRLGDTAFLILDSWEDKPAKTPGHPYCQWNLDEWFLSHESEWLGEALKSKAWCSARRHIVFCHGAAYSHFDACRHLPYVLQKMTDQYFEGEKPRHFLNLWMAGHVHRYLRSVPGTNVLVGEKCPPAPAKGGENYAFPVLTVAGPRDELEIKASCFRVDADTDGFTVSSWDQHGKPLEKIRYDNAGHCIEEMLSMHHFPMAGEAPVS